MNKEIEKTEQYWLGYTQAIQDLAKQPDKLRQIMMQGAANLNALRVKAGIEKAK
jgi:hypothetical protein